MRKILVAFGVLFASYANAQVCPPQYQETMVQPSFQAAKQALNQGINAVDQALSQQEKMNSERMTSAISVLTKQKALAASQIADNNRIVQEQVANSLGAMSEAERVKKARFDFGGEFGQGYSPCKVYAARQVIANRDADMAGQVRERVTSEIVSAPGKYVPPLMARKELVKTNRKFCTQDQVDSGLCTSLGTLPGKNLQMATLFEPAIEGEDLYAAKVAFVNNVAPVPDPELSTAVAKTAEGAQYSLAKARKDALVSPALAALKEIQLDYSGVQGAETGTDLPLAVHFQSEVNRYMGNSPEYKAWAQVMAAQNERGLLVENLKINALKLAIQERNYRQYERMEALLASLVSLEVQTNGSSALAAVRASRNQATGQIKP